MSAPTVRPAVHGGEWRVGRGLADANGWAGGEPDWAIARAGRLAARHRLHGLFAAGDTGGVVAAGLLVAGVEPWLGAETSASHRYGFAALACLVVLTVFTVKGLYAAARRQLAPRVADDVGGIVTALGAAGICLLALGAAAPIRSWFPPVEIAMLLGTAAVAVPVGRMVAMVLAARNPANVSRVVIVGGGYVADILGTRLARSRLVQVLGIVDDSPPRAGAGQRVLGTLEDLPLLCRAERVDRIVIAFSGRHPGRNAEVLQELRGLVDIDVVVRYFELANWESRLSDITGLSLISIGQAAGPVARAAKRALDVAIAGGGLLVLSPLLLVVGVAVRVSSGAPILFRQTRIGRDRRPFCILKFRTMRPAGHASENGQASGIGHASGIVSVTRSASVAAVAPAASGLDSVAGHHPTPLDTVPDPARITWVGSFLRRTGLDELPQLINVLRGEMSLVGPRPFIPQECVGLFGTVERRFAVRPGITGMWQVCGQHEVAFDELCRLDVQYATSWSLRGDLRILARTPGRLLRGSGPDR